MQLSGSYNFDSLRFLNVNFRWGTGNSKIHMNEKTSINWSNRME